MDTPTKQRLVGAAVLVALAVIFLPMLVKGPAPDSGVSDVPLDVPAEPAGDIETRDLPLIAPQAGADGALGAAPVAAGDRLPTVDTADAAAAPLPAGTAGGAFAVHFGSYATTADADTIVRQLRAARLAGFREATTLNGRQAWRVRIGPFATRAEAEAARLDAGRVRDDVGARVVVLDAAAPAADAAGNTTPPAPASDALPAAATAVASPSQPVAKPSTPTVTTEALPPPAPKPSTPPAPKPAAPPVASAPSKPTTPAPVAAPKPPATASTGFAVQVGAFGNAAEATKLRDRLRAAGFTAFTESVASDKGPLTRVRVGPVLTRAEADQLRAQVGAKAGVSGIVRPHP